MGGKNQVQLLFLVGVCTVVNEFWKFKTKMFPVLSSLTVTQGFLKSVLFILFCNLLLKICTAQVGIYISKLTFLWSACGFMNIWKRLIAGIPICIEMHLDQFIPVPQVNTQWYFTANQPVLQIFSNSLVLPCRTWTPESKKPLVFHTAPFTDQIFLCCHTAKHLYKTIQPCRFYNWSEILEYYYINI